MKKLVSIVTIAVLAISSLTFSGCAKGEEDPFFSIHTRDARLTQAWNMVSMTGTVVTTVDGLTTNVEYEFDGTNLKLQHIKVHRKRGLQVNVVQFLRHRIVKARHVGRIFTRRACCSLNHLVAERPNSKCVSLLE